VYFWLTILNLAEWFIKTYFPVHQVLIRLIGADEHMYANYMEAMQWIEDTDVLEMIVDKFSSSVSNITLTTDRCEMIMSQCSVDSLFYYYCFIHITLWSSSCYHSKFLHSDILRRHFEVQSSLYPWIGFGL
jgi:hypothetical protein